MENFDILIFIRRILKKLLSLNIGIINSEWRRIFIFFSILNPLFSSANSSGWLHAAFSDILSKDNDIFQLPQSRFTRNHNHICSREMLIFYELVGLFLTIILLDFANKNYVWKKIKVSQKVYITWNSLMFLKWSSKLNNSWLG